MRFKDFESSDSFGFELIANILLIFFFYDYYYFQYIYIYFRLARAFIP